MLNELINSNQKLKKEIQLYCFSKNPFIDDAIIKGGYRVVRTIKERNSIDCCHRKLGMRVMVIGQDYSYKEYILKGEDICSNNNWNLVVNDSGSGIDTINDSDITLLDDYSNLDITQNIETQQDLNRVLSTILQSILLQIQSIEDKNYIHEQNTPLSIWSFIHPLNKKVAISIEDTAGNEVEGKVVKNDGLNIEIHFNFPFSGKAILN